MNDQLIADISLIVLIIFAVIITYKYEMKTHECRKLKRRIEILECNLADINELQKKDY